MKMANKWGVIMNNETLISAVEKKTLISWLFNPFRYVAGGPALGLGVFIIVVTSLIGYFSRIHFDGVIDFHPAPKTSAPLWLFVAEGLIDWLSLSLILTILATIVPPRNFRIIDVFGTQALARWPHLLTSLAALPPGFARYSLQLMDNTASGSTDLPPASPDAIFFWFGILVMILALIWVVTLMYQGFSVSCHLKGVKGAVIFIIGLVAAEILSKITLLQLINRFIEK
jgi:hypothetical protein